MIIAHVAFCCRYWERLGSVWVLLPSLRCTAGRIPDLGFRIWRPAGWLSAAATAASIGRYTATGVLLAVTGFAWFVPAYASSSSGWFPGRDSSGAVILPRSPNF